MNNVKEWVYAMNTVFFTRDDLLLLCIFVFSGRGRVIARLVLGTHSRSAQHEVETACCGIR